MTTAIERLEGLLDQQEEEIAALKDELSKAKQALRVSEAGWSLPRVVDDSPDLPIPRLEISWTQSARGWQNYSVEYRLIVRHYMGYVVVIPFGLTEYSSVDYKSPFDRGLPVFQLLPMRDRFHMLHDAAHLCVPAYALTDKGPVRIDNNVDASCAHVLLKGKQHIREPEEETKDE